MSNWWQADVQQENFRRLLNAFARPGTISELPTNNQDTALSLLGLMLDETSRLCDENQYISESNRRLMRAQLSSSNDAQFILLNGMTAPTACFSPQLGSLSAPEHGATIFLIVTQLSSTTYSSADRYRLRGPGISGNTDIFVSGLNQNWVAARNRWVSDFPLGVDLVLCSPNHFTAIPRTTQLVREED